MNDRKKLTSTDVGRRIKETKQEIAHLSEELERLIKSNLGKCKGQTLITKDRKIMSSNENIDTNSRNNISHVQQNQNDTTYQFESSNSIQSKYLTGDSTKRINDETAQISSTNVGVVLNNGNAHGSEVQTESEALCRKNKSYNKEAAQEYIKHQREKREKEKKKTDSKTKIDQELRKQKLQELHQKSLAIVKRNIELLRERSRSRDNRQVIRFDRNTIDKPTTSSKTPTEKRHVSRKMQSQSPKLRKIVKLDNKTEIQVVDSSASTFRNKSASRALEAKGQYLEVPSFNFNRATHVVDTQGPSSSNVDENYHATRIQALYRGYRSRKKMQTDNLQQRNLEPCSLKVSSNSKESRETQTNQQEEKSETPVWLNKPPVDPYPCNFINAIRRKLEFIVNSPVVLKDVSTRQLESEPIRKEDNDDAKRQLELESIKKKDYDSSIRRHLESESIKKKGHDSNTRSVLKNLTNSDPKLKSFGTHKCTNLDVDALKHLALVHGGKKGQSSTSTHEKVDDESESDTSKNIPELSTESDIISKHSRTEPNVLNNEKIRNLTLRKRTKSASSSRDSIISFNKSDYEEVSRRDSIISFNRSLYEPVSPKNVKTSAPSQQSGSTSISDEIKTETNYSSLKSAGKSTSNQIFSEINTKTNNVSNAIENLSKPTASLENKKPNTDEKNQSASTVRSFNSSTEKQENGKSVNSELSGNEINSNEEVYSMNFSSDPSSSVMNKNDELKTKNISNSDQRPGELDSDSSHGLSENRINLYPLVTIKSVNNKFIDIYSSDFSSEKNCEESGNNRKQKKRTTATIVQKVPDSNQIHLKFEAEVHLLNDFNESFKQLIEVEKAFKSIKNKNEENIKDSKEIIVATKENSLSKSILSSINLSRGSDFEDSLISQDRNSWKLNSAGQELSTFDDSIVNKEEFGVAGLSLCMFEQFIKDEDVRIKNLKTIIKIRERALLDRTKCELAWLEIQRKNLKETGKIQEASLVKKKQRGILLKHEQERREMQRLKQLQEIKSKERKIKLKEQRDVIKAKLLSPAMMPEFKIQTPRIQNQKGPMRVLKNAESVLSETSISRRASDGEEMFSITSKSQSIRLSEIDSSRELVVTKDESDMKFVNNDESLANMNKALLARQAALMKRRQDVEDLLKKHEKLLEEEKKIRELENVANAIIMKIPTVQSKQNVSNKLKIKGQKLNELGTFTTRKFSDNKTYSISKSLYEKLFVQVSEQQQIKSKSNISEVSEKYSDDFDLESQNSVAEGNLSSIDELIEDFSKIEEGILKLSQSDNSKQTKNAEEPVNISHTIIEEIQSETPSSSIAEEEESVIHTQKNSVGNHDKDELSKTYIAESESVMNKTYSKLDEISNDAEILEQTVPQIISNVELTTGDEVVENENLLDLITLPEISGSFMENEKNQTESICENTMCLSIIEEESKSVIGEALHGDNEIPSIEQTPSVHKNSSIVELPETINSSEPTNHFLKSSMKLDSACEILENKVTESFEGISSLFRSDEQIAQDKNEENTDISEKLLTDSDYENSTENYSEDFEDDYTENDKKDEIVMMRIDFSNSKNQAKIVILENEKNEFNKTSKDIEDFKEKSAESDKTISSEIVENLEENTEDKSTSNNVSSPAKSVESFKQTQAVPLTIYGNEAEELMKKQLAIEQEIKHLEEQQKALAYVREIPNKPPPPYTPPASSSSVVASVNPAKIEDLNEICNYSAKVLYNAYLSNNLNNVTFSETHFESINKIESTKECCLFVFDLCREIAKKHYDKFEKKSEPAWLKLPEESRLFLGKPYSYPQLEKHIISKVKELFGFANRNIKENSIIRWSRKKKDHVDNILISESLEEEQDWLNYEKDELMVLDELTDEIFDILLLDTFEAFEKVYS